MMVLTICYTLHYSESIFWADLFWQAEAHRVYLGNGLFEVRRFAFGSRLPWFKPFQGRLVIARTGNASSLTLGAGWLCLVAYREA